MLKVVCVVDKDGTALDRLAKGVAPYHDNLDYIVCDVHPKRPSMEQLQKFEDEARDADVIDWQYYRTAEMLKDRYSWLADKKQILTHNNPYSIKESNWSDYDVNVGNNDFITEYLRENTPTEVEYIPLTVDTDHWTYKQDFEPNNKVIMVANRIESKKGILPVAQACQKLNLRLILVGAISDPEYWKEVMGTRIVEFYEQISDEKLKQLYHNSTLHICNSIDNFESGTLPILEAMLCGVPVLTRKVGHVPDLYNGENLAINESDPDNIEALIELIETTLYDKKKLLDMRDKAWNTAKARSNERRAYLYQKLYRKVLSKETSVSIVVPIYDKPDIISQCLSSIAGQDYPNIELLVADDNPENNYKMVQDFAKMVNFPVRYLNTAYLANDYGLARARNEATIEATGEIMVYVDQRMILEPNAISQFVKYSKPRHWLYGNKGSKKEFVENFSSAYRMEVINAGMFCERINQYGGMSQELRSRIRNQGMKTEYVESAKAIPKGKSNNRNRQRQSIIQMKSRLFKMNLA